jgi:hypothetical protein
MILTQPICFVEVLNVSNIPPALEIAEEAFYIRMQAVDLDFVTADMDLCHVKKLYSASQKRRTLEVVVTAQAVTLESEEDIERVPLIASTVPKSSKEE